MKDYWTVWGRARAWDELSRQDSYDTLEVAKEMAEELFSYHGWFEVLVRDSKGNEVAKHKRGKP